MEHGNLGDKAEYQFGVDASDEDFNEVEKTGGEKKHTLTTDEEAPHSHYDGVTNGFIGGVEGKQDTCVVLSDKSQGSTAETGGGQPFNIMQPYIACYMWKRVA